MRTRRGVVFARVCYQNGVFCKFELTPEAERQVTRGNWYRKRVPGQRNPVYVIIPAITPSKSLPSPTGITCEEMMAVVGIGSALDIARARGKFEGYRITSPRFPTRPMTLSYLESRITS